MTFSFVFAVIVALLAAAIANAYVFPTKDDSVENGVSQACAKGYVQFCVFERADLPAPNNAAERACAAGFTQWCIMKRDEDDVEDNVVSASIDDHILRSIYFSDDGDSDNVRPANPPKPNIAQRACDAGFIQWCTLS